MNSAQLQLQLDEIARDLDLVVYRLEREPPDGMATTERKAVRRELERLRDQLEELVQQLG